MSSYCDENQFVEEASGGTTRTAARNNLVQNHELNWFPFLYSRLAIISVSSAWGNIEIEIDQETVQVQGADDNSQVLVVDEVAGMNHSGPSNIISFHQAFANRRHSGKWQEKRVPGSRFRTWLGRSDQRSGHRHEKSAGKLHLSTGVCSEWWISFGVHSTVMGLHPPYEIKEFIRVGGADWYDDNTGSALSRLWLAEALPRCVTASASWESLPP